MIPIKIAPLLTDLRFSPKIEKGKTFDPYFHYFSISQFQGYGMGIVYQLQDEIIGNFDINTEQTTIFSIVNDQDAPESERGDIETAHYLTMNDELLKPNRDLSIERHHVKWEGFNDSFKPRTKEYEKCYEIYKDGEEAVVDNEGIGPRSVCSEGKYEMRVGLKSKDDDTQIQKYSIKFEVKYETK